MAAERNNARERAWVVLGLLTDEERWPLLYRAEQMRERLAEQARTGDISLMPWALGPEAVSPVPLPAPPARTSSALASMTVPLIKKPPK